MDDAISSRQLLGEVAVHGGPPMNAFIDRCAIALKYIFLEFPFRFQKKKNERFQLFLRHAYRAQANGYPPPRFFLLFFSVFGNIKYSRSRSIPPN